MQGQYNGQTVLELKRVWYSGTSTLKAGQLVNYSVDDTAAPVTGADPSQTARGQNVTDPATANLGAFAGVVADSASGKTGPCWIDIIIPNKGDVVQIYCNFSVTKLSSIIGVTNAGGLNGVSVSDSTFNLDAVAVALQTVDRSSTSGLVLAKFI